MGKDKGINYAAFERLESIMAIGESRHEAKAAMRAETGDDPPVAASTRKIHSFKSREKYQGIMKRFIHWCKEEHHIFRLAVVDARAEELVSAYLRERLAQGLKPATLRGDRCCFRLFFQTPKLAEDVLIPPRLRQEITRSRKPAARDKRIAPALAEPVNQFLAACGVRRDEADHLRVRDVQPSERPQYQLEIDIKKGYGKGGRVRRSPVYPGKEQYVLARVAGLAPDARLFPRKVDSRLNPQAQRRQYAQDFYQLLSGRELPPTDRRLRKSDYDKDVALEVARYLGHSRIDVFLRSYLR